MGLGLGCELPLLFPAPRGKPSSSSSSVTRLGPQPPSRLVSFINTDQGHSGSRQRQPPRRLLVAVDECVAWAGVSAGKGIRTTALGWVLFPS